MELSQQTDEKLVSFFNDIYRKSDYKHNRWTRANFSRIAGGVQLYFCLVSLIVQEMSLWSLMSSFLYAALWELYVRDSCLLCK